MREVTTDSPEFRVSTATEADLATWDDYVLAHPDATFFHRAGWFRVIRDSFRHRPFYLQAKDASGRIRGVLPAFEQKSLLFGHALISLPFCVYGGGVADSPSILRALEDAAADLAHSLNVDYLELRNVETTRDDWPTKSLHATFQRALEGDDEAILLSIKNKQRAVVRKGLRNNLTLQIQDDVDEFFHAYSTSVRNLGTPVFSRRYFQNLKKEFGNDCEIVSVKSDEGLECSLISFYFRDHVLPYYGGGMPQSRGSKAMDFMYYDQMCRAAKDGRNVYDFGRSKVDSGPYNYKRHWGFEPRPLHYQYALVRASELPEVNVNNPKYQKMISLWRKLPLRVSQILGPFVSRYLG
ncbi:MAG: FemAB family PEP-CTERM system-associated protein [Woeseiaceae bacterium]|nr:FemAB family PEP-CTERM system-associated protein [Woeseiaceae bacterium]